MSRATKKAPHRSGAVRVTNSTLIVPFDMGLCDTNMGIMAPDFCAEDLNRSVGGCPFLELLSSLGHSSSALQRSEHRSRMLPQVSGTQCSAWPPERSSREIRSATLRRH